MKQIARLLRASRVETSRAVGEPRVVQVAHASGITAPLDPVPSIALGALEVTPLELVTGYAAFDNGGWRVTPRLVRRIVAGDGTVFAETRSDGVRVYPQESLAGQTIGHASPVTADDLKTLAASGYAKGDWVGRSGLEKGADALLRGSPGFILSAIRPGRGPSRLLDRPMVPGAEVTISPVPVGTLDGRLIATRRGSASSASTRRTTRWRA